MTKMSSESPETWCFKGGWQLAYLNAEQQLRHREAQRSETFLDEERLITLKQVHGNHIVDCDEVEPDQCDALKDVPADALVWSRWERPCGVWGSDCPGLWISCSDGPWGMAHCGWRGTALRLPEKLCHALAKKSTDAPVLWTALIGPGVSWERYEVDDAVLDAFPWPESCLFPSKQGRQFLDLKGAIAHQLRSIGIQNIHVSSTCTHNNANLHSFRRDGVGPNQLLMARRNN
jgi:copper oxidase (laccase) domain-containing protein